MLMRIRTVYYNCGHIETYPVRAMIMHAHTKDAKLDKPCSICSRMREAEEWRKECLNNKVAGILTGETKDAQSKE